MGGYLSTLKKYAVFSGRATIKEYWIFTLVNFVIVMGLYGLAVAMTGENGQPNSLLTGASVSELPQLLANSFSNTAAYACVYFVKYKGGYAVPFRSD